MFLIEEVVSTLGSLIPRKPKQVLSAKLPAWKEPEVEIPTIPTAKLPPIKKQPARKVQLRITPKNRHQYTIIPEEVLRIENVKALEKIELEEVQLPVSTLIAPKHRRRDHFKGKRFPMKWTDNKIYFKYNKIVKKSALIQKRKLKEVVV